MIGRSRRAAPCIDPQRTQPAGLFQAEDLIEKITDRADMVRKNAHNFYDIRNMAA